MPDLKTLLFLALGGFVVDYGLVLWTGLARARNHS